MRWLNCRRKGRYPWSRPDSGLPEGGRVFATVSTGDDQYRGSARSDGLGEERTQLDGNGWASDTTAWCYYYWLRNSPKYGRVPMCRPASPIRVFQLPRCAP